MIKLLNYFQYSLKMILVYARNIRLIGLDLLILTVSTFSLYAPRAFYSNQNQYFIHVVANVDAKMNQDWLSGTLDTNQFFTWIFTPILKLTDTVGIQYLTYPLYLLSLIAIYVFIQDLYGSKVLTRFVCLTIAFLQSPIFSYIFSSTSIANIFVPLQGLGGQSIFLRSGYIQPSSVGGIFLLFGIVFLIKQKFLLSSCFAILACMFHPSLLFSVVIIAILFYSGSLIHKSKHVSTLEIILFSAVIILITFACNPNLLHLFNLDAVAKKALFRFAFERIPHHTLITDWPKTDLLFVIIWVIAIILSHKLRKSQKIAFLLLYSLIISIFSALFVYFTRIPTFALMFPWRLSVGFAPIIYAVAISAIFRKLNIVLMKNIVAFLTLLILPLSAIAAYESATRDPYSNQFTLVSKDKIIGVGFTPLDLEYIRLKYRLPIYVDWKSPPYAGSDLVEWWHRIDTERQIFASPELFCDFNKKMNFGWVVWPNLTPQPSCLGNYIVEGDNSEFRLFIYPTK